jgi:hypothetical protein
MPVSSASSLPGERSAPLKWGDDPIPWEPMPTVEGLTLAYSLYVLPPGRFPFHRWRWELWHGARLVAAGWRTSRPHAERALRAHAGDFGHSLFGLRPPRVDPAPEAPFRPGASVRLQAGSVAMLLVPRAISAPSWSSQAAGGR